MKKKVIKLFFVWQDESEQEWLSKMAEKGWFLEKYKLFYYVFDRRNTDQVIYRLDYKIDFHDFDTYQALFEEAGWEYVTSYLGWHYFRGNKDQVFSEDIYSDHASIVQKYRRVLQTLLIVLFAVLVSNIPSFLYVPTQLQWLLIMPAFSAILLVIASILIQRKIKLLSRSKRLL